MTSPTAPDRKYAVRGADTFHTFCSLSASSFKNGRQWGIQVYKHSSLSFFFLSLPYSSFLSGSLMLEVPLTQSTLQRNYIGRIIFAKGEDHHYSKGRIFQASCIILTFQHLLLFTLKLSFS